MGTMLEFDALSDPNLRAYKARAVVDWMDIAFTTSEATNFATVQEKLRLVLGSERLPYVVALNEGPGRAATHFWTRLQDPEDSAYVQKVLARLAAHISILGTPVVRGIEIAVDFYSNTGDRGELEDLTLYMKGAIHPEDDALWIDSGEKGGTRLENVFSLRSDTTLRITGEDIGWRVYLKETDQNKRPITDASEHRVRVEVTLSGARVPEVGSADFRFESLARHFRFRRPVLDWVRLEKPASVMDHIIARQAGLAVRQGHSALERIKQPSRRFSSHTQADGATKERVRLALRDLTRRYFAQKPEKF